MHPDKDQVKRPYDATLRRGRAAASRGRMVAAARVLFLSRGYTATTVTDIARAAGTSPDTVYKAFGGKPGLVKAVFDAGIAGSGPEPTDVRAAAVSLEVADPAVRLRAFGGFVAEVTPRVAPLMLLVRSAAEQAPELAVVEEQMHAERLASMTRHAQRLADDGHLRDGVSVEEARDVLWTYTAPELYDLLVQRRGWDVHRFGRWVGEAYVAALL